MTSPNLNPNHVEAMPAVRPTTDEDARAARAADTDAAENPSAMGLDVEPAPAIDGPAATDAPENSAQGSQAYGSSFAIGTTSGMGKPEPDPGHVVPVPQPGDPRGHGPVTDRLPPAVRSRLAARVARLLHGSAFERRSRWASAVVVLRPEGARITSRADFASWLGSHDLKAQAREAVRRRVPAGSVLLWIEADDAEVGLAGFVLFGLADALAEAA